MRVDIETGNIKRRQAVAYDVYLEMTEFGVMEQMAGTASKVLVWPNPTPDGHFIAEYEDGHCEYVSPRRLKFLDGKQAFSEYEWNAENYSATLDADGVPINVGDVIVRAADKSMLGTHKFTVISVLYDYVCCESQDSHDTTLFKAKSLKHVSEE